MNFRDRISGQRVDWTKEQPIGFPWGSLIAGIVAVTCLATSAVLLIMHPGVL